MPRKANFYSFPRIVLPLCLLLLALLPLAVKVTQLAPAEPTAADLWKWRHANSLAASADSRAILREAALEYDALIARGLRDGALFHNLGVVLLLSGDISNAYAALRRAERWSGDQPGQRRNLLLALSEEAGRDAQALPWRRIIFRAHYALGLPLRMRLLACSWILACLGTTLVVWNADTRRASRISAFGHHITVLGLVFMLLLGVSTGISVVQEMHDQRGSCKTPCGMGVPPMKHGQDARATLPESRFCKSLQRLWQPGVIGRDAAEYQIEVHHVPSY